jgi:hypothetical protein
MIGLEFFLTHRSMVIISGEKMGLPYSDKSASVKYLVARSEGKMMVNDRK